MSDAHSRRGRIPVLERLECRVLLAADLTISELMAINSTGLLDRDSDTPDWVEIHNATSDQVDLAGWTLTDDPVDLDKWEFPSVNIEPDQYLVVFASGKDRREQSHLLTGDMNATEDGTFVIDLAAGQYELRVTMGDAKRARDEMAIHVQGELREVFTAAANEFVVKTLVAEVTEPTRGQLLVRINDLGGSTSRAVINALTVTPTAGGEPWRFDFGKADSRVEPGYVGVTADDTYDVGTGYGWLPDTEVNDVDRGLAQSEQHTNFQLRAGGDYVALVSPAGEVVSEFGSASGNYPPQFADVSYGIVPSAEPLGPPQIGYLLTPTPGTPNETAGAVTGPAIRDLTENPGLLDDHADLAVTATIEPTNAAVESVTLTYRVMFGDEVTVPMTDDGTGRDAIAGDGVFTGVIPQSAARPGEMVRWYVVASDTRGETTRGPLYTDDLDAPEYFGTVVADISIDSNLPVLHWFVENPGAAETFTGTEASLFFLGEFYDGIHFDMHGQSTSSSVFPKKSFDVDFHAGRKFKFAEGQGRVSDFNLLTNYGDKTKLRNTLAYGALRDAGHAHHVAFPVRVQRNGGFFSIHDWVGEGDTEYLERLGMDPNGALYKMNNEGISPFVRVEKRTRKYEDRNDLQALIDSRGLERRDLIDMASWVNHFAARVGLSIRDCCHKNYYLYRDTEGTGQWQILPWDVDLSLGHYWNSSELYFDNDLFVDRSPFSFGGALAESVREMPGFREMFLRRTRTLMDELLQPPGTPQEELKYEARIDALITQLGDDAALDQDRWGFPSLFTPQSPAEAAADLKDFWLPARREYLYETYNRTASASNRIPNAQVGAPDIEIAAIESLPASGSLDQQYIRLDNPNSFAVDISDWRLAGDIDYPLRPGTVIPSGGSLYVVANVPAFLRRSEGPGAGQGLLIQGDFDGPLPTANPQISLVPFDPNQADLRITELNYNPHAAWSQFGDLDVDNDQFEFVELMNMANQSVNLHGVALTDGVAFTFGDVDLAAGERILVVRNRAAFQSRYGTGHLIAGEFVSGKLSNGGEQIRLNDGRGRIVVEFTYNDGDPWPGRADGKGGTLEVVDTEGNYSDADNWRSSSRFGGTPGRVAEEPRPDVIINEILSRGAGAVPDQIELYNTTGHPIDLSGWYLAEDSDALLQFALPAGTILPAEGYLAMTRAEFGFGLSGTEGDDVWLIESDASGRPVRFADHVDFGATDVGVALGRWSNGDAYGVLFPMTSASFGSANRGPAVGPVVISEVDYNPAPLTGLFYDFTDGTDAGFEPVLGTWQVIDGRYEVTPGPEGDTIATIPVADFPTGSLRISATLHVPSVSDFRKNAALIFDYQSPTDFKFVLMPTGPDEWRIGNRDDTGWHFVMVRADSLETDTDVDVAIEIEGSVIRLIVDGLAKFGYDFGTLVGDGLVGLGSNNGVARFDDVRVEPLGDWQRFEFIEIANTTADAVDLSGWRLSGGVDMTLAAGSSMGPGDVRVIVGFDPADAATNASFRSMMGVAASVELIGPYTGHLSNGGEVVRLSKPINASDPATGLVLVDRVDYDDQAPWPAEADGQGMALSRTAVDAFGGFAASWRALVPTPGTVPSVTPGDLNFDGHVDGNDVDGFVLALSDPNGYAATYGVPATMAGDVDGDGDVDFDDIDEFVALVTGGVAGTAVAAHAEPSRSDLGEALGHRHTS